MANDILLYGGIILVGFAIIIVAVVVGVTQSKQKSGSLNSPKQFPAAGSGRFYGGVPAGSVGVYEIGASNSGLIFSGHPTLGNNVPTYREKVGTPGKLNNAMYSGVQVGGVAAIHGDTICAGGKERCTDGTCSTSCTQCIYPLCENGICPAFPNTC